MASNPSTSEESLICCICLDHYDETNRVPMVLGQCGHSICKLCLEPLTRNGRVSCPKCRVSTQFKDVKTNFDLRDALIHNRWQDKAADEKDGGEKPSYENGREKPTYQPRPPPRQFTPPRQQQRSSDETSTWLAVGAAVAGAAVFGITGFILGRSSNRQRK